MRPEFLASIQRFYVFKNIQIFDSKLFCNAIIQNHYHYFISLFIIDITGIKNHNLTPNCFTVRNDHFQQSLVLEQLITENLVNYLGLH